MLYIYIVKIYIQHSKMDYPFNKNAKMKNGFVLKYFLLKF